MPESPTPSSIFVPLAPALSGRDVSVGRYGCSLASAVVWPPESRSLPCNTLGAGGKGINLVYRVAGRNPGLRYDDRLPINPPVTVMKPQGVMSAFGFEDGLQSYVDCLRVTRPFFKLSLHGPYKQNSLHFRERDSFRTTSLCVMMGMYGTAKGGATCGCRP